MAKGSAYYDLRVLLMDTDTPFRKRRKTSAQTGEALPCGRWEVDDPETGERFGLEGLWLGPVLDKADLQAMMDEFFYYGAGGAVTIDVSDNGQLGEGLWLSLKVAQREGNPESHPDKWGDERHNDTPVPLLAVRLTAPQAAVLGEALLAAARLRAAQEAK